MHSWFPRVKRFVFLLQKSMPFFIPAPSFKSNWEGFKSPSGGVYGPDFKSDRSLESFRLQILHTSFLSPDISILWKVVTILLSYLRKTLRSPPLFLSAQSPKIDTMAGYMRDRELELPFWTFTRARKVLYHGFLSHQSVLRLKDLPCSPSCFCVLAF